MSQELEAFSHTLRRCGVETWMSTEARTGMRAKTGIGTTGIRFGRGMLISPTSDLTPIPSSVSPPLPQLAAQPRPQRIENRSEDFYGETGAPALATALALAPSEP